MVSLKRIIIFAFIFTLFACNNSNNQVNNNTNPFLSLNYDKVTAYDYETKYGNNIIDDSGKISQGIVKQIDLSKQQIENVTKLLTDKSTYGGEVAKCFIPRLGIVFYKENKAVAHISICLECNSLHSSIPIPAEEDGFSKKGREKINSLCKEFNFIYCLDKLNTKFD